MGKALAQRGHHVVLYTTDVNGPGTLNPLRGSTRLDVVTNQPTFTDGYEVWYFPVDWPSRWRCSWPLARRLAKTVRDFDVVHIHTLYAFTSQVAAFFSRRAGVPYLIRFHGTLDPFLRRKSRAKKWLYDALWQKSDIDRAAAIHYTAQDEMELAAPLGFKASGIVVPLGLDLDSYRICPERGEFRSKHLHNWKGPVVLYLGRINFKKGLEVLIDAFAALCAGRRDTCLAIVGHPDPDGYADSIRRRAAASGAADRIFFTGPLFGREKLEALADADIWALPSHTENFGVAVVEAMAMGLPVIVSHNVAIHHEISRSGAGLVVSCDPADVKSALEKLLENPSQRGVMGANGRALVREKYSLQQVGKSLEQAYLNIVQRNGTLLNSCA
ncbi:MAG: glycosyltransferase [Acidobacteria bacterium]|nr:glycosyltransferase [Acidobacteriota bacterium]